MKDDTIHIICNEFSRGIGQTLDWWKNRLLIYKNYTLASIINQTNKNFVLLLTIDNKFPLRDELEIILKESGLKYLLMNKDIENDFVNKIETLPKFDYVLATRIDSDDLFRNDVVEELQKYDYGWRKALIYQKGYCYNCIDKKLQHYKVASPPNSSIMYTKEIFLDEKKNREYLNIHGHDQVFSSLDSTILDEDKYIVLIHGKNRRSIYEVGKYADSLGRYNIPDEEHEEILNRFGISSETYKKMKAQQHNEEN